MDADVDVRMRALAERQHSALSVAQARALGATAKALRNRRAEGDWQLVGRSLRLEGSVRSFRQRCEQAVLDAGPHAALSHESALALFGVPGFDTVGLHVSRRRGVSGRPSRLAVLHQPRLLPEHHVTVVDGIRTTRIARALFDCAGTLHPGRAERALGNALSHRLVALETMRRTAIELFEHGRPGSALVRRWLAARGAGYIPPASSLEARLFAILAAAGEALPDRQVDVGGEGGWIGRVDAKDPIVPLIAEADSDRHHSDVLDTVADEARDAAFEAAGFVVVRFDEDELRHHPDQVLARYRAARTEAAALLAPGSRPSRA